MFKKLSILAVLTVVFCGVLFAAPQRFMAALGTNTVVEFDVDRAFQLVDATATTNGVAVDFTVNRIWVSESYVVYDKVETNLWGTIETNSVVAGPITEEVTNTVYDSTSDTLPTPYVFLTDEVIQVDFDTVTNGVVRIVGSDE